MECCKKRTQLTWRNANKSEADSREIVNHFSSALAPAKSGVSPARSSSGAFVLEPEGDSILDSRVLISKGTCKPFYPPALSKIMGGGQRKYVLYTGPLHYDHKCGQKSLLSMGTTN